MGPVALRLAVVAGAASALAGLWPGWSGGRRWAWPAAIVSLVASTVALLALARAFWTLDLSLAYVADHARRDADRVTRLTGTWGGMGGSLLFFAVGAGIAGTVAAWRADRRDRGPVAAVGAAWCAALLLLVAWLSDPFDRLEIPAVDGAGLTPILEHAAMRYHPPLLYAGLTSLAAPFVLTVAALASRRLDDAWCARVRRWLLVPWVLLAVGMLAGAHWAYVELGWGGYWAWDPVENTALLPWLAVTAALHGSLPSGAAASTAVTRRTVAGLVTGAFALSVLGALLTRSGATSSVHAFAEARSIGRAFAVLLAVVVVGLLVLLRRLGGGGGSGATRRRTARGWALAGHQVVVLSALLVVLVGSLWPLQADLRGGREVAVGGWFFAAVCGPLAVAGLALMAVGPLLGRAPLRPVVLGAVVGGAAGAMAGWTTPFAVATAVAGGAALAGAVRGMWRAPAAGHVAHVGAAVLLLGVAGTTTGTTDLRRIPAGAGIEVQGHDVTNHGVRVSEDGRAGTRSVVATVEVDGRTLTPELVAHLDRDVVLSESALHSTPWRDVQLMLRHARDDGSVLLQIGVHPLQQWVWWGGLVLTAGGAAAFVGALRRRSAPVPDDALAVRG